MLHSFAEGKDEHTRSRRELHVDWLHAGWLSQHWSLDDLRIGHGERKSAVLRGDSGSARNSAELGEQLGPGFLPAAYQGTDFNTSLPIRNLARPESIAEAADKKTRDFLKRLNDRHLERFPGDTELAARISSYELAAKMQLSIPEVRDLSTESAATLALYGADDAQNTLKAAYAKNCILARRLLEQGVRFVQLFNGAYQTGGEGVSNWDGHKVLKDQYSVHGPVLDQPTAALITDLKQRGLLKDTLVVWCTEFGRMPTFQKGRQRARS